MERLSGKMCENLRRDVRCGLIGISSDKSGINGIVPGE